MPISDHVDLAGDYTHGGNKVAESVYYVTVLSNLVRGYDKYSRVYDKSRIPESTFLNRFFLLSRQEIGIGIAKASPLTRKTGLPGDRLMAIETHVDADELQPNRRTGLGRFLERSHVTVHAVHFVDHSGELTSIRVEEAYALSLRLHFRTHGQYELLAPRSVSVLPIAKACQARCPFCFSKASVSTETEPKRIDWQRVSEVFRHGWLRGAGRAVITGGGEPSLLDDSHLHRLTREAASVFPKVVLISNGFKWGRMRDHARATTLRALDEAGLSVLSISRHHFDSGQNSALMNLATQSERVAETWSMARSDRRQLKLRWTCVLQRGGIENRDLLERYLDWAFETQVQEVCFKELYVSTSIESEYYDQAANDWSARHQVSLRIVLDLARDAGWQIVEKLPWGAPIFEGNWRGRRMRVAAYTEPSLFWEIKNGICRSWNLMADGRCLASLEDRRSTVLTSGLRQLQTVT